MTASGVHVEEIKRFLVFHHMFLHVSPGSHVELKQSGIQLLKNLPNGALRQFVTHPDHHVQITCLWPPLVRPELKKLMRPSKIAFGWS